MCISLNLGGCGNKMLCLLFPVRVATGSHFSRRVCSVDGDSADNRGQTSTGAYTTSRRVRETRLGMVEMQEVGSSCTSPYV